MKRIGTGHQTVPLAGAGGDHDPEAYQHEDFSDALTYYQKRERWEKLGREVATFRDRAKRDGVAIETLPGARFAIEAFKKAGQDLDRRVR